MKTTLALMNHLKFISFGLALLSLTGVTLVQAKESLESPDQITKQKRCKKWNDSLGDQEAQYRINWFKKCEPGLAKAYYQEYESRFSAAGGNIYPTFGVVEGNQIKNPKDYQAPHQKDWQDQPCNLPQNYQIVSFCVPGCYYPYDQLATRNGDTAVKELYQNHDQSVLTVGSQSTPQNIHLQEAGEVEYITDLKEGWHHILQFETRDGGKLRVTPDHVIMRPDGTMDRAYNFKEKDRLVRADGSSSVIQEKKRKIHHGRVYNVRFPDTSARSENLVISNGFLTGSQDYQEMSMADLNRILMRNIVPVEKKDDESVAKTGLKR